MGIFGDKYYSCSKHNHTGINNPCPECEREIRFRNIIETSEKVAALTAENKRLREDAGRMRTQLDFYNTWMDGRTHCPPYGIPVLGYLQRSMDMEYELDIVHFELNEKWMVSTTMEPVDVLFWHVLPEPPNTRIQEGGGNQSRTRRGDEKHKQEL